MFMEWYSRHQWDCGWLSQLWVKEHKTQVVWFHFKKYIKSMSSVRTQESGYLQRILVTRNVIRGFLRPVIFCFFTEFCLHRYIFLKIQYSFIFCMWFYDLSWINTYSNASCTVCMLYFNKMFNFKNLIN